MATHEYVSSGFNGYQYQPLLMCSTLGRGLLTTHSRLANYNNNTFSCGQCRLARHGVNEASDACDLIILFKRKRYKRHVKINTRGRRCAKPLPLGVRAVPPMGKRAMSVENFTPQKRPSLSRRAGSNGPWTSAGTSGARRLHQVSSSRAPWGCRQWRAGYRIAELPSGLRLNWRFRELIRFSHTYETTWT